MKKGQGLSMSVIVMAAIALLVLVILAFIFMGRLGVFSKSVGECKTQSGICAEECGVDSAINYPTEYGPASPACDKATDNARPYCCLPI